MISINPRPEMAMPISQSLAPALFASCAQAFQNNHLLQYTRGRLPVITEAPHSERSTPFSDSTGLGRSHSPHSSNGSDSSYHSNSYPSTTQTSVSESGATVHQRPQKHRQRHQSQPPLMHYHSESHQQQPQPELHQDQTMDTTDYLASPSVEQLQFNINQEQTTLVLGVLNYLERLERQVADMREFVKMGFRQDNSMIGDMDGGFSGRVEKYVPNCSNIKL